MRPILLLVYFVCFVTGCSDYAVSKIIEYKPEITVTPQEHDFGNLRAADQVKDLIITIGNIGTDDLRLDDVYLVGGASNFTLGPLQSDHLAPSQFIDLVVTYDPATYETNSDIVSIWSNDEDEEEVQVMLGGVGDAPVIHVTPTSYDFGTVLVGCEGSLGVLIENIGNADLEISDLEYFASLPVDFSIEDYESSEGLLPWTLPPGDWIHLRVGYTPLDILDDGAWLEVTSNDPVDPITVSEHQGMGDYETWVIDSFTQDGEVAVDILFVVDNSGSMSSNQTNLKNNFDDFIAVYVIAGVDYHIALITTDDASFVGNIITPTDSDPAGSFNDQVDLIRYGGSPNEKGLWYSYVSTDTGGDAAPGSSTGFFRESAKFVVVYVSDEPDYSHSASSGGGSTTMGTSDYSAHLLSLKSSSILVAAHAVAGDYPSGCTANGGAQFGDGYYDVVSDLGGTFMSICADDWSVTMDTLARESMAMVSFPLSDYPVEDTISVEVDGVTSTDWVYDNSVNSVTFTVVPADESSINITYAVWAECEEEETDVSESKK